MAVSVEYAINVSTDKAVQALKGLSGNLAGVAQAVFDFGKAALGEFAQSEQSIAKLNGVLKATKGIVGITSDEMQKMATQLQGMTQFSDEAVMEAEAMLLTYNKIGKQAFPDTLKAAADLASLMGGDMKSAAQTLGKAMQEPEAGLGALRRAGITFTDQQEELIKGFVKTGDAAKAQGIILKEVEGRVGGLAEAMGQTANGQMAQMNNALSDIMEDMGKLLYDALKPLIPVAKDFIAWIKSSSTELKPFGDAMGGVVKIGLEAVKFVVGFVNGLKDFSTAIGLIPKEIAEMERKLKDTAAAAKLYEDNYKGATKATGDLAKDQMNLYNATRPLNDEIVKEAAAMDSLAKSAKAAAKEIKAASPSYEVGASGGTNPVLDEAKKAAALIQKYQEEGTGSYQKEADARFAIVQASVQKEAEVIKAANEQAAASVDIWADSYKTLETAAKSAVSDIMQTTFESIGKGALSWETFKNAAKGAIAAVCEAMGKLWAAEAVAAFFDPTMGGPLGSLQKGIASAMAFTAAGFIKSLKTGGEFTTQGPQMLLVGDNASGREHVTVTPDTGGGGSKRITLIVGNREMDAYMQESMDNGNVHVPSRIVR